MLESGENYLKTILELEENGAVRSVDLARKLALSKPSISRAVSILRRRGYLEQDELRLCLTQKGREQAIALTERHALLTRFFVLSLGLDAAIAAQDACHFEHSVSDEALAKMKEYVEQQNR